MCFVPTKHQAPCLAKAIEKEKKNKNPVMAYEVVVECMKKQNGTNDIMGEVEWWAKIQCGQYNVGDLIQIQWTGKVSLEVVIAKQNLKE